MEIQPRSFISEAPAYTPRTRKRNRGFVGKSSRRSNEDNLLALCLTGQLKAKSLPMRKLIGSLRHGQGERFNDRVADLLSTHADLKSQRRVKKIGGMRFDNLGDIDILVGREKTRCLFVIECKDFSASRTPHELAREIEDLSDGKDGRKSVLQKHRARTKWIEDHLIDAIRFLQLPPKGTWKVHPVIVVDEPMMSSRLVNLEITILTVAQLNEGRLSEIV